MKASYFRFLFPVVAVNGKLLLGVLLAGLMMPAITAQAQNYRWKNAGDGPWETAGNWHEGSAPSEASWIYITNAASKTVTISASTPAANLTITNIVLEAAGGATNTLLITGNTDPLRIVGSGAFGNGVGAAAGRVGQIICDGGTVRVTNESPATASGAGYILGNSGTGILTLLNNASWIQNRGFVGSANGGLGLLNILGGTFELSGYILYVSYSAGSEGRILVDGGTLVATNANSLVVGYSGRGYLTVSNGFVKGKLLQFTPSGAAAGGYGEYNIHGGTNEWTGGMTLGIAANTTGALYVTRGLLSMPTNRLVIGSAGCGLVTLSGGRFEGWHLTVRSGGGDGSLTVSGGDHVLNGDNYAGSTHLLDGSFLMTGGSLTMSNCNTAIGNTKSDVVAVISNGTLRTSLLYLGYNKYGNRLYIAGGSVFTDGASYDFYTGYNTAACSNNLCLITGGGFWKPTIPTSILPVVTML